MSKGKSSVRVEVTSSVRSGPGVEQLSAWASKLLRHAGAKESSLSILLCGDRRMRGLNRSFLRKDRPTDVLSFPAREGRDGREGRGAGGSFLGDLAIDLPYAARQARRRGHPVDREVQVLLAHGILHLLGHDHETDSGEMFGLQRNLVRKAFGPGPDGLPDGAAGRGGKTVTK